MTSAENELSSRRFLRQITAEADFKAMFHSQPEIGLEHLIFGIAATETFAARVLSNLGISPEKLTKIFDVMNPRGEPSNPKDSQEVGKVWELAKKYAGEHGREIEPEDLLLATTWIPLTVRFGQVLQQLEIKYPDYKTQIQDAFRE